MRWLTVFNENAIYGLETHKIIDVPHFCSNGCYDRNIQILGGYRRRICDLGKDLTVVGAAPSRDFLELFFVGRLQHGV